MGGCNDTDSISDCTLLISLLITYYLILLFVFISVFVFCYPVCNCLTTTLQSGLNVLMINGV